MVARYSSRSKTHLLGQHLLVSARIAERLVEFSGVRQSDTAFEIGTGEGRVTTFLAKKAHKVITCDIDREMIARAKAHLSSLQNIEFLNADAFSLDESPKFDVCVTSLPYSRSSDFIEWLSTSKSGFRRVAAILQSDFVSKLLALPGERNYRAISVLAQLSFEMTRLQRVSRKSFRPVPRVDSEIVSLSPRIGFPILDRSRMQMLRLIFSSRGRLLRNAVANLEGRSMLRLENSLLSKRVERLTPEEYAELLR